jgi:AraC family transcriptional regulator of adaptative response/methylated-DNA-[protein]-cysteine methyltransferase
MIFVSHFESPIGELVAGATDQGICLLEFSEMRRAKREMRELEKLLGTKIAEGENDHLTAIRIQLDGYFNGTLKQFTVPVLMPGTDFQREVWTELLNIPFGTTRSYQEQANAIGRPDSVRAVANANGTNRISIVIPCHRIIGSDGRLVGYGGGLGRKKWLLDHERRYSGKETELTLFQ